MNSIITSHFSYIFSSELKNNDNGVSSGVLLLTVKDYCLGRSNKFIGESIIPLQELQCIDSSCKHTVPNIYLKVTQPGMECGEILIVNKIHINK